MGGNIEGGRFEDSASYARFHKRKTGYSLREEQVVGVKSDLTREQLLAQCRAFEIKRYGRSSI